ncbi:MULTISPECIES: nitronate monooxygenase family protein [unclassified Fusibacter]|uniref:NAD(P)H-dependent flavin oxidoreductase n=1 Tax=unclassified Fusibacter TaxID=2624464 RepID=UPI001011EFBB|nr:MULTISPECIES: nitronate monooxygenase [unclassified Fusibacter]MCK8059400.1 nitronate monooxygenase [Fusibacter sp. A2]NPE21136.1 nitronate monooxygenase [Fusibacter sp. A1]RXV62405.1 nitronate monooxygenase [Fusibacter sp. A1]
MKFPSLQISKLKPKFPIIQGGMAVKISTARLAAAVANEGGIGIIAGTGLTIEELKAEIRKARELTDGIIGVNILFAVSEFADLVKVSIQEGIDLVISGAGFSRDMFQWGKEAGTPIVPIVSSSKGAKMAEKLGASAIIVEGKEAGGHLGTDRSIKDIITEVIEAVKIPVVAAGGIMDGFDIHEFVKLGVQGVQMGTRFAATHESNASEEMKAHYISCGKEDVVLVDSPVGLPGRALKSTFTERIRIDGGETIEHCVNCLKRCSRSFCIMNGLYAAVGNDIPENALYFSGENIHKITSILSVKEVFENLKREFAQADAMDNQ